MRIPLPPDVARQITGFDHRREWVCACGARLRIRAREPRADGPSNFAPGTKQLSTDLTWNGLAAERGWITREDGCQCPACQAGVSVAEYKRLRAAGQTP